MSAEFPWLTAITLFPLLAALPIPILPDKYGNRVRWYSLSVAIIEFAFIAYAFWGHYDISNSSFQLVENYTWLEQIG